MLLSNMKEAFRNTVKQLKNSWKYSCNNHSSSILLQEIRENKTLLNVAMNFLSAVYQYFTNANLLRLTFGCIYTFSLTKNVTIRGIPRA